MEDFSKYNIPHKTNKDQTSHKPCIYLICDPASDLYKIGVTRNLSEKRMKQIQNGNGNPLHIICTYHCEFPFRMESILHRKFGYIREEGEWFRLEPTQVINFMTICKEVDDMIELMKDNIFFSKNLR